MGSIQLTDLHFGYQNSDKLFDNIELQVSAETFVFILGENGSGKSTLLKLILGACSPSEGQILIEGEHYSNAKKRASLIGYIPQSVGVDPEMHVSDILSLVGSLHLLSGRALAERKSEIVEAIGLETILDKRIKLLSGGQRQLVNIAVGLIHDPKIVLLDEPFVGLDYGTKSRLLAYLKSTHKTVLCVTHDLDMAEANADKILVLKKGKVKDYDSPQGIIKSNPYYISEVDFDFGTEINHTFSPEVSIRKTHNRYTLICKSNEADISDIEAFLDSNKSKIKAIQTFQNNLKSTLIGRYQFSFAEQKAGRNKKKNKKK